MKTSQKGIELIKSFEGLRLHAYKPIPNEKYYTIGYGHYGIEVSKDMAITEKQAEFFLKHDLIKFETMVNNYNASYHWNQNEFDALVSFAYNIGNINGLTDNGKRSREQIAHCMLLYIHGANNCVLNGLVARRNKEHELFKKPCKKGIKRLPISYIVKKGDTISSIAKHYHTTVEKLVKDNEIKDANKIFVGELIKIL